MQFKKLILILVLMAGVFAGVSLTQPDSKLPLATEDNNCSSCHSGIEPIRAHESLMMTEIRAVADQAGFTGNDCIVCHGGNPNATEADLAHKGTIAYFKDHDGPKAFYPDPGSPWINEHTCGSCHAEQVDNQFSSLMFTEAGKIQGTLWGFGGKNGYNHDIGNYEAKGVDDPHEALGTETYKKYMADLMALEPQLFPKKMVPLKEAPTAEEVEKDPSLAVYTYLRQECQRCHTGDKGRQKRGDFRGMGCTSCHVPYGNEGKYEGNDPTIDKSEPGHMLVHSMQGTRKAQVKVHDVHYSGIPVETCTTCHDRGKRIGTSYQGLMETAYNSPFLEDGSDQQKLHTKKYIHLHADIHKDKGMFCQDCHTSGDVHSDGLLMGTTLAPVEIECEDCHGTPQKYPWELPIGWGDEVNGKGPAQGEARGLTSDMLEHTKKGTVYDPKEGYLLTARGNPLTNVVKDGDKIIVHTAGGLDLELDPLRKLMLNDELSEEGLVAMCAVEGHMEKLECYACHSVWAPQCYGCHIKIDYSNGAQRPDWIAMGNDRDSSGLTADARGEYQEHLIDGKVSETRSYLRWENPPLVVNGENRVSPAIPGCQTTVSVIGKDGTPLMLNHIFKIPNVEGAGEEGQLGIDVSPVQPHTISKASRTCEGCHNNAMAMGYGIEGGTIYEDPSKKYTVDLTTQDGQVVSKNAITQVNAIPNLEVDWSRIVTEDGRQTQTVGHHYSGSRPLNNEERAKLDRRGVCMSCHQDIPGDLAVNLLTHVKDVTGFEIDKEEHGSILNKTLHISAWAQIGLPLVLLLGVFVWWRKKKRK